MRPDSVPLGSLPPVGVVPRNMLATVIRKERYGDPVQAMQTEEIAVPEINPDEVLIAVISAGVNYNNVWASLGYPVDLIGHRQKKGCPHDFHIGGSDAAGIVYKTGSAVSRVKVGDEVVVQGGIWDHKDPFVLSGGDPVLSPSFRAWGYEINWGSFAQFCVVKDYQCLPRPQNLSWDESAVYMLTGATIYRMLFHWQPNTLKKDDVVLIWGGAGGLGVMAIQLVREFGGIPVAVVNNEEKAGICRELGAAGVVNRSNYTHWGMMPSGDIHSDESEAWRNEAMRFSKDVKKAAGDRMPAIVIEHPGEMTMPSSLLACRQGGMVVTCGGTTGYAGSFDLRYLWVLQKRIQGSHFASLDECFMVNQLVEDNRLNPVLSKVYSLDEVGQVHQMMLENLHPHGNLAVRIGY